MWILSLSDEKYFLMNMPGYRAISKAATVCCICRKGSGDVDMKADENCIEMSWNEKLEGGESNAATVTQRGGKINYALEQER